jgi:hypothetical protein
MNFNTKTARRITTMSLATVAAVATIILSAAFATSSESTGGESASHTTNHSGIQVITTSRLISIAKTMAKISGDASPAWVTAVKTVHVKALSSATPGDTTTDPADTPVYLLTMKGHFTARGFGPSGAAPPTVAYLSIVVNARSFRVMDLGFSHGPPVVSPATLGRVVHLSW